MSKASREWKESCKHDNRLTNGTSWSKKDMTLSSYKAMKREDQRWFKIEAPYLKRAIEEVEAKKSCTVQSIWGGCMKYGITVSIGS